MKISKMLFLSIVILVSSSLVAQSSEEAKVLVLENAWNVAQKDHDNRSLEMILADTFIDTEASGAVMNKGQFLAYIKDPSVKHASLTSSDVKIQMFGTTAVVSGTYHDRGTDKGEPYDVQGRFTDTWVQLNAKWQCVSSASTQLQRQ